MTHGSLFSGIGGFDLAAEWMGWENIFHCEIEPFNQKILKHYWPKAISYADITKTDFTIHRATIDILTGGFPCQPYSQAGKRLGKEDDRHLWPYMLRTIQQVKPRYIVGENVYGIVNWNGGLVFDEVQTDLESEGYEITPVILPACAVGAIHRRDRTWFIAHSNSRGAGRGQQFKESQQAQASTHTNGLSERLQESREIFRREYELFINASDDVARGIATQWDKSNRGSGDVPKANGLSERLDGITVSNWKKNSIKSYGNAIVPQVAYEIFKAIEAYEQLKTTNNDPL